MKLGLHISIAGGLPKAIDRALRLGCDTLQIFAGNPRGWQSNPFQDSDIKEFIARRADSGLAPLVVHMPYLPNLASDKPDLLDKSTEAAREQLRRSEAIGADFLVCHMGKADDPGRRERMLASVRKVLGRGKRRCTFLLENTAGQGREMGRELPEIGALLDDLGREDTGLCLDTCHAHAAGYDLSTVNGNQKLIQEVEEHIGIDRLKLLHLNDSKKEAGQRVDRHEEIGKGTIGKAGFKRFLAWAATQQLPGILETPRKTDEDDLRNLAALRKLQPK